MNSKRIARIHEELVQGLERFSLERLFFSVGYEYIVGLHTDGKEAVFGPLVTCGVIIDVHHSPISLKGAFDFERVLHVVDEVPCSEVNRLRNVDEMIRRSKRSLVERLCKEYSRLIVVTDYLIPELPVDCFPIMRGDLYVYTLKLATYISKELRKEAVLSLLRDNPCWYQYDLETNLGFLSKKHRQALSELGKTPHHRYFVKV